MSHSIQCPFCGTIWSSGGSGGRKCTTCGAHILWNSNGEIISAQPRR